MAVGNKVAEAYVQVSAQMDPLNKQFASIKGKIASLAATRFALPGGGLMGSLGLAGLGAGVALGISKALHAASDLQETLNRVGVVFGASGKTVIDAANEMAAKFGVAKTEFMNAAVNLGRFGQVAGMTNQQASELGVKLAKLALDLSSIENTSRETAFERLSSALAGEVQVLRRHGAFLNEQSVQAEAVRMGIGRWTDELTEQQKTIARLALVMRDLNYAAGDMANTSDGFANAGREVEGRLVNIAATIGEQLLPAAEAFQALFNQILLDFSEKTAGAQSVFEAFAAKVKAGLEFIGVLYRNWGLIVEYTGTWLGGVYQNMVERVQWLGSVFQAFIDWFRTNWMSLFMDAARVFETFLERLGANIVSAIMSIREWIESGFTKPIEFHLMPLIDPNDVQTKAFEAPALVLSDVADQLKEIEAKMGQVEQAHQDRAAGLNPQAAAEATRSPAAVKPKTQRAEFVGVEEFAKRLQSGIFEKDPVPRQQLTVQQQLLGVQQRALDALLNPRPAPARVG